jgi:signal recognition particle GTPase
MENEFNQTRHLNIPQIEEFLKDYFFDDDNLKQFAIEHISIHELTRDNERMKTKLLQDLRAKLIKNDVKNKLVEKLNNIVDDYKIYREELSISRSPFYLEFRKRFP